MKKILAFVLLSLVAFSASAQTVISRTAEYQRVFVQESQQVCDQRQYNPAGVVIGSVIGYGLGREIDRNHNDRRGYHGGYYDRNRGNYYRDDRYGYSNRYNNDRRYDSRSGRYIGAIGGGLIGSQVGNGGTRCYTAESGRGYWREVLVGYNVTYRDYRGNIYTQFEPTR